MENVLRMSLWNKSNRVDEIIIRLAADAKQDFDNYYDAYSFGTGNIGLASIKNSEKLAIQARPIPINADSVALSLNINQMDSLLFKFENTSSFNADLELFFDKQIHIEIFVKVNKDWRNNAFQLRRFGYNQK